MIIPRIRIPVVIDASQTQDGARVVIRSLDDIRGKAKLVETGLTSVVTDGGVRD